MSEAESVELVERPEAAAPMMRSQEGEAAVGPQYFAGFAGAGEKRLTDAQIKILAAPVVASEVEVKPNGIVYLPWPLYNKRLNEAFGQGNHALVKRGPSRVIGNSIMFDGALIAEGRLMAESVGGQEYYSNGQMSWADAHEGAKSDCLTKCCKTFGTAMELWDPSYREKWLAEYALRAWLPAAPKQKEGFYYWRKDRATPWQVAKAGSRIENGIGGAVGNGPKAPAPAPTAVGSATPALASPGDEGPRDIPGVGPSKDDLADLADMLVTVKWPQRKAKATFLKYFGCLPDVFTPVQMKAAHTMLMAFAKDTESEDVELSSYRAAVAELQAAGIIAKGAE